MHKCSSVYSERGVPLLVLTSGGERVGVRACKNATRVPPNLCDVTQTSDSANPPYVRVERDSRMCVARDLYELWGRIPYTRMFLARTSN
jgi:hypothetical protein